jgi:capsular polysaccharide biosynthesis protein
MKYHREKGGEEIERPREDLLIHFLTRACSVTPPEPLAGDSIEHPTEYPVDPLVLARLRGGAVTRNGLVFSERNELLRESLERRSYVDELATAHPSLAAELKATLPEPAPDTVAILASQRAVNYFHWWIDVLPRCWAIQNSPYRGCRLVTPPLTEDFQRESLELLGQRVIPLTRPMQRFRQVIFVRGLTYGSSQAIAPQVFEFAQWCRTTLGLQSAPRGRKLFLSRRRARSRRLTNEDEVLAALGADFELVELETLGLKEETSLLSEASVVVATHGAGLTNLLFCNRPTAVVELVHEDAAPHTFRRMAGLLGHPYMAVTCEPERRTDLKPGRRSMTASPSAVAAAVERLEEAAGPPLQGRPEA